MKINIPHTAKSFFANNYQAHTNQNILLLCFSEEEAISAYHQSLFFKTSKAISEPYYLPSFDTVPYDRISPNNNILSERAKVLSNLANSPHNNALVITNAANLLIKLPPPEIFTSTSLALSKGMKYTLAQLSNFLIQNGFIRSSTAIDSGEFAMRGEMIDIVLQGNLAYRINFSWNQIESIKQYDLESQISTKNCDHLILNSASEIILNSETINNFKNNYLTTFGVNHTKELLYESVIKGRKFPGFEHLLPLFYNQLSSLLDYLPNATIIYDNLAVQSLAEYEFSIHNFYNSRFQSNLARTNGFYPVLLPERLYFSNNEIVKILKNNNNLAIEQTQIEALPPSPWNKLNIKSIDNLKDDEILKKTKFDKLVELMNNNIDKVVVLFCRSNSGCERLKNIISSFNFQYNEIDNLPAAKIKVINIVRLSLKSGFSTDKYLLISEQDFFGEKFSSFSSLSSKARLKNILTELYSLQVGELIVYKEHGIGQFFAVETIEVGGKPHDCLKILYAGNDFLYVPVENIELIKKYGNFEGKLDKLGSLSWQKRKSKLKNRINDIADELLKIAAVRKSAVTEPVEYELSLYDKFCSKFTYSETEDQLKAIEDVKKDLTSGKLMDRLICGDVGFGKTEIAIRTAYMLAANTHEPAQIAIIAPTTILCKQHYSRFLERFRGFGFNILQLSRLIKKSEIKSIKEQIKNGRATIIVGTHALLAKDIEFSNLKLLIIDEEQHFGVSQKERLKQLKSEVHVLSLSATPIPRTLQMSLVGLKELSLIATPPLDRIAVRTTVMPFDDVIIRDALLREHFRGGRSFYVCPRIKDILEVEKKLQAIVPELKYRIAHGQMPPVSVEDVMNEFYDGKVDILLSTTIIESGIDISTANTMIIHKADQLGLSQLYQLRGRVGRSNVRGYAYLTLNNNKKISKHVLKRLEIMQNVDSLGAGFTVASHDMDIRGFGNLVGEEQSGQIKEVGVELYQEMLDEQIGNLKNDQVNSANESFTTTINLGLPVFIPEDYVNDSSLRLGIYRRVGSLSANEEVESFKDEIIDRFGPMPKEFDNLLNIVKIKLICQSLKIESLDSGTQGFVLKFYKNANVADIIIKFINKYPRSAKIKPDNKLIFIKPLENQNIIKEVHELLNHLRP